MFQHPERARSNSDYLPLFVHDSLRFPPGTREEYSNAGYIVLGEIVAHVSHEDYYSYVTHHLFEPAGMKTAGFYARDSLPGFVALGYTRGGNGDGEGDEHAALTWSDMQHPRRGSAAGGSYASARDLLMLIRAYRAGRLGAPPRSGQSLIAGGSPGSNGVVAEGLPGGYDLIVLENLDPPAADAIVAPVMSWLGAAPPLGARRVIAGGGARPVSATTATLPDTPAGHIAADYLRAYNSGDTVAMAQFFETRAVSNPARPTAARLEAYRTIFADNGRLTVLSVNDESATSLELSARGEHGATISLVFTVDQAAPHKLTSLQVEMSH